jgi:hypothetical protein
MATKDEHRLTPFSSKEDIPIDNWLNLYEIVCDSFKLTTNVAKITRLMAYLKDDALLFFSTDIAPHRNTLTWDEVRHKLETRFGSGETEPMTAAIRRTLKREEKVKIYYNSKVPLLQRTGMDTKAMCAALTEGLPHHYKSHFYGKRSATTLEWLQLASDIEADINSSRAYRPSNQNRDSPPIQTLTAEQNNNSGRTSRPQQQRQYDNSRPPPTPCQYCQQLGRTEFHWHKECPNRRPLFHDNRPTQQTAQHNNPEVNTLEESFATIALN